MRHTPGLGHRLSLARLLLPVPGVERSLGLRFQEGQGEGKQWEGEEERIKRRKTGKQRRKRKMCPPVPQMCPSPNPGTCA